MKQIEAYAPDSVRIAEVATPEPGPGEVRVRTAYCGICATDIEILGGTSRMSFPFVPGHEWCGVADSVGSHDDRSILGKRCVAENVVSAGGEVGFEHPGGYGEYFLTDAANIHELPDEVELDLAALIEPIAVCVRGLERLSPNSKNAILIIGDGPIGLLMTAILRYRGFDSITIVGGRTERLEVAESLGASELVNYHGKVPERIGEAILGSSERDRFDAIIEATGSADAIHSIWNLAASNSRVLLIGDYEGVDVAPEWQTMLHREITLVPSNASEGGWVEAINFVKSNRRALSRLVTHRFDPTDISSVERGLEITRNGTDGVIKAMLEWDRS